MRSLGFVTVVFSGVYLYLSCSLGFVTVAFSGVYLYLSCSLGFVTVVFPGVCNCCVLWGVPVYMLCYLGFVRPVKSDFGRIVIFMHVLLRIH